MTHIARFAPSIQSRVRQTFAEDLRGKPRLDRPATTSKVQPDFPAADAAVRDFCGAQRGKGRCWIKIAPSIPVLPRSICLSST